MPSKHFIPATVFLADFFAVEKVNKNDKIVLFSKTIHGIQVFHNYLVVSLKIFKKFATAISTANVAKFGN